MLERNGVIEGRDGYLFLVEGNHHVLRILRGELDPPDQTYSNFATNTSARADAMARAGIPWCHVIFPDKQTVLKECFVSGPFLPDLGQRYLDKISAAAAYVLYPREDLIASNAVKPVFYKTDSHNTHFGMIRLCTLILDRLGLPVGPDIWNQLTTYAFGEAFNYPHLVEDAEGTHKLLHDRNRS